MYNLIRRVVCLIMVCNLSFQITVAQETNKWTNIPDALVKLRINLILLRNDDGEGGFDPDNEEHMHVLRSAVGWMNGSLRFNAAVKNPECYGEGKCFPERDAKGYEHISETKIRFEIGEVLVFDSSKYWHNYDCQDFQDNKNEPKCPENDLQYRCPNDETNGNWYLNKLSQAINQDPDILPAINIFFSEDADEYISYIVNKECSNPSGRFHTQSCSESPDIQLDKASRVHMRSQFLKYSQLVNCKVCEDESIEGCLYEGSPNYCCGRTKMLNRIIDGLSRLLLHELGHSILFTSGHCSLCPGEGLMHATRPGKSIHPAEIDHAHYKIQTTNLAKYIVSNHPILIERSNQLWTKFMNLHKDYIIKSQRKLTLENVTNVLLGNKLIVANGQLEINEGAKIYFKEASSLIVEKGSELVIKSGAEVFIEEGATINIKCGGVLLIEEGAKVTNYNGGKRFQYPCNELIGPSLLEGTSATYKLPFDVPEVYINWSVFPEDKVSYYSNGNSITIKPIQLSQSNLLIRADLKPPYADLWSTKIVWLGNEEPLYDFVKFSTQFALLQFNQLNRHFMF